MPITIFVIPSLNKDLFLGIDFWEKFKLLLSEFRRKVVNSPYGISELAGEILLSDNQKSS